VRRRGLEVIRLDEVRNRIASPRGEKFISFTFDGGYRDSLLVALPIFREFGYSFAVNITTGFANRAASAWWYSLEDLLGRGEPISLNWEGTHREWPTSTLEDRERAFAEIAALIRSQSQATRDALVEALCEPAGINPLQRTRELMLDWNELTQLASDWYVTIGCQTVGHHVLRRLTTEELEGELIEAKAELEARLGKDVHHLAYPFGGRDAVGQREFNAARECDYLTAFTTRTGNLFEKHAWHLQALPRLGIDGNHAVLPLFERAESGLIPARDNYWRRVVVE
jgi:peptidoglycan/xylan/chitin deacetylase (PgdA/CDA1 family)